MAQRLGQKLQKQIPGIDRIIGAQSIDSLKGTLHTYLGDNIGTNPGILHHKNTVSAFLPIMRGCNNYCSYCVVPYVRGPEQSIPIITLLEQANQLISRGIKEIILLGQNVNSYCDGGHDFADLLERFHALEELSRIRFTTSHPKDIGKKLIHTVSELPKICKHIHLPVQSGSTEILKSMNRGYNRNEYFKIIDQIRNVIPDIDITTDVMVGFPGETEKDFKQTFSLFEHVSFTNAFMFAFSKRSGTKAATMTNHIPETVKINRLNTIIDLQTTITKSHYQNMVGKDLEVLFIKRQDRKDHSWIGQNNGCKRVLLASGNNLEGCLEKVRIIKSTGMTLLSKKI